MNTLLLYICTSLIACLGAVLMKKVVMVLYIQAEWPAYPCSFFVLPMRNNQVCTDKVWYMLFDMNTKNWLSWPRSNHRIRRLPASEEKSALRVHASNGEKKASLLSSSKGCSWIKSSTWPKSSTCVAEHIHTSPQDIKRLFCPTCSTLVELQGKNGNSLEHTRIHQFLGRELKWVQLHWGI